ncbi:Exportin-1 [Venturia inaequalis]|nr:Exportin-1 [Venturia inaequalis]
MLPSPSRVLGLGPTAAETASSMAGPLARRKSRKRDTESTAEQPVRQSQRTQAQLQLRVHYSAWDSGSQTIPGVTTYNQYAQAFHRGPPGSSWYKVVPGPPVNSGCTLKLKEKNVSADTVAIYTWRRRRGLP